MINLKLLLLILDLPVLSSFLKEPDFCFSSCWYFNLQNNFTCSKSTCFYCFDLPSCINYIPKQKPDCRLFSSYIKLKFKY